MCSACANQLPRLLFQAAHDAVEPLFSPGLAYRRAGIHFLGLVPANPPQQTFLLPSETLAAEQHLAAVIDHLNARFGRDTVSFGAGTNLKDTYEILDAFTEIVREEVGKGKEVRLMGFGAWSLRNVAARKVKSIRGGNQITIPARKRVGFSAGAVPSQAAGPRKTKATSASKASATPRR